MRISHSLSSMAGILVLCTSLISPAATLPQYDDYQKVLRDYMATIKETDVAMPVLKPLSVAKTQTEIDRYRDWLIIGTGAALNSGDTKLPASVFLLKNIEGQNIMKPSGNPYNLINLVQWRHPQNPFFNNKALKKRAFVLAALDLIMHDNLHEKEHQGTRSDYLGGTLIWLSYSYLGFKDEIPEAVQTAYLTGLKKLVARVHKWGPTGIMTDMDLFAPIGLYYAAVATGDAEAMQKAEAYSQRLFTQERFFNPSGYFVDNGCFDTSYNGISLFFTTWAAHVTPWPFVKEALDKSYRLRGLLSLPDYDGKNYYGPTHFSSRTSGDPAHDQWSWGFRHLGAAMITDYALYAMPWPDANDLQFAAKRLNDAITTGKPKTDAEPWKELHWGVRANCAAQQFTPEFYKRIKQLKATRSPLILPPFDRPGEFIESINNAFLIAKQKSFGVVIHTGPIGHDEMKSQKSMGFSGGSLSAFWTPATGPVFLGRRRGIQGGTVDSYDEWRIWPINAIMGATPAGKLITSARNRKPVTTHKVDGNTALVEVSGELAKKHAQGQVLNGYNTYARTFTVNPDGLTVVSKVDGDGTDEAVELYEVLPVFLGDRYLTKPPAKLVKIRFETGGQFRDGTTNAMSGVTAIRIERGNGAIKIAFKKPQKVKLSKEPWVDGYMSQATCRNIMIDLLGNDGTPVPLNKYEIEYTISAAH